MNRKMHLGAFGWAFGAMVALTGCSHAVFPGNGGGGGGNNTSPIILTMHDSNPPTLPSGVTVTAFEVTLTGASLTPVSGTPVSLLSTPQTIELTQLQTNAVYVSTTQVALATYTSLALTYASPQYTIFNGTGTSQTINGQACAAGAECVIASPTIDSMTGTVTFSSSIVVGQSNQTLIEADVNLNDLIQSNFDVDFSKSIGASVSQVTNGTATTVIGNPLRVSGQVLSVGGSNQFTIKPAIGPQLTITTAGTTTFEFGGASCTANNFTCIAANQIVDVMFNTMADGTTFQAMEVDFDDAASTQQVSGQIVAMNATPPTSFTMVVHNTIPPAAGLPNGSLATVTIGNSVSFVVNNGSFVLPAGLSFGSTPDVIVGQEVEARVASGTSISSGAFTTDRLALEQTQLQATATNVNATAQPPQFSYALNPTPALFTGNPLGSVPQIQVQTVTQGSTMLTLFQALSPASISGVSSSQLVTTGGFLFNTPVAGSPTIVATVVRGEVAGT